MTKGITLFHSASTSRWSFQRPAAFVLGGALLCVASRDGFLPAQQPVPVQPGGTITVQASLVVLDVVVTDAAGKPVPGLTLNDFHVEQNGQPVKLVSFESPADRPSLPETTPLDRDGRPDWGSATLNIFLLDQLTTPFEEQAYAAKQLEKYLAAQPALLPMPSMLVTVGDHGYRTLQGFTRDRDLLLTRIRTRPPALASQFTREASNDTLTTQSLATLQQVALAAGGGHNHRNLIWIGRGFPAFDPTDLSVKAKSSLDEAVKRTTTLLLNARTTLYKVDPMPTTTELTEADLGAALDIGMDPTTSYAPEEDPLDNNFNLNVFAQQTGGQYFYGLNSLDRFIGTSVEQGRDFYTLSYRPPAAGDGSYQTIRVTLTRPGLLARTREGYYPGAATLPPITSGRELGAELGMAATGGMEFTSIPVHVVSAVPETDKHGATVTVSVEDRSLEWQPYPDGEVATLNLVLVALDAHHEILTSAVYTVHPFLHTRDLGLIANGQLTLRDTVPVPGKTAALRVLVRDSSGRIGSADVSDSQLPAMLSAR